MPRNIPTVNPTPSIVVPGEVKPPFVDHVAAAPSIIDPDFVAKKSMNPDFVPRKMENPEVAPADPEPVTEPDDSGDPD